MPKSVIQNLLDESDEAEADVVDGSSELEVTEKLRQRASEEDEPEPKEPETEPEEPKTASEPPRNSRFDAQVAEAVAECQKMAADYGAAVKTASQGDRPGYESLGLLFSKVAHLLGAQAKSIDGLRKYAKAVVDSAADDGRMHAALKVASELIADGTMDMPTDGGQNLVAFVRGIAGKDLGAVKVAHDMFRRELVSELGSAVAKEKTAQSEDGPSNGSMEDWLRRHPSLSA